MSTTMMTMKIGCLESESANAVDKSGRDKARAARNGVGVFIASFESVVARAPLNIIRTSTERDSGLRIEFFGAM